MYCNRCGVPLDASQRFCPKCGTAVHPSPMMPARNRVAGHIRLLGILWLAIAGLRLIPAFVLFVISNPATTPIPPDVPPFVLPLLHILAFIFLAYAAVSAAIGWGLLKRQTWSRMLSLIFGVLALIDPPFGTALGIYTLWVLLPAESGEQFRQLAEAA